MRIDPCGISANPQSAIRNPQSDESAIRHPQSAQSLQPKQASSLSTLLGEPDSPRLARGDSNSRPALKPESGGNRGNAGSHPFPSPRSHQQEFANHKEPKERREGNLGKDSPHPQGDRVRLTNRLFLFGFSAASVVKLLRNRNPCVLAPLRHRVGATAFKSLERRVPDGR